MKFILVKKSSWKEGYIFTKYSRNLNIFQVIFWLRHMKYYFQNTMGMISWHQPKLDILSFKSNQFEIYPLLWNIIDQSSIEYWNFLNEHVLHNFIKYFSGTQVNQMLSKYLNGYCLTFVICYFCLYKKCLLQNCIQYSQITW